MNLDQIFNINSVLNGLLIAFIAFLVAYIWKEHIYPRLSKLGRQAPDISGIWKLVDIAGNSRGSFDITQRGNKIKAIHHDDDAKEFLYTGKINPSGVCVTTWQLASDKRAIGAMLLFKRVMSDEIDIKTLFLRDNNGEFVSNDYKAYK